MVGGGGAMTLSGGTIKKEYCVYSLQGKLVKCECVGLLLAKTIFSQLIISANEGIEAKNYPACNILLSLKKPSKYLARSSGFNNCEVDFFWFWGMGVIVPDHHCIALPQIKR